MRRLVWLLALAVGCAPSGSARDVVAAGPKASIEAVRAAAVRCGLDSIRHDPLDDARAVLLADKREETAFRCTRRWITERRVALKVEWTP